jgi:hypothetical protein
MATNPKSPVVPQSVRSQYHVYHAEAHVLSGNLKHPVEQPIEHKARVVLEKTRRDGHISQSVAEDTMEGLISFKAGHTRASGTKIEKKDLWGNDHSGWVTLSTSVLEGLNVFEVITVDRVVAQVSTEHPMTEGHVPRVTFLGTRFENLRIGGYKVEVELDLGICGNKPEDDRPYLEDSGFLDRVERQLDRMADTKDLPEGLEKKCSAEIAYIDDLRKCANGGANGGRNGYSKLPCSLVKSIGPIPVPGVRTFGNLIYIPNFGTVALAELEVGIGPSHGSFSESRESSSVEPSDSNYFMLKMLGLELGCPVGGSGSGGGVSSNGTTHP